MGAFTADEVRDMNLEARNLEDRRIAYLKHHGYLPDHLATMVEDQKCQAANAINNKGMRAQLQYLLKQMPWSEIVESLQNDRRVIVEHFRVMKSGKK